MDNLKEIIQKNNRIQSSEQRFIFNNEDITMNKTIPLTSIDKPIMLISRNFHEKELPDLKSFPPFPTFQPGINCDDDLNIGKRICGLLYFYLRKSDEIHHCMGVLVCKLNIIFIIFSNLFYLLSLLPTLPRLLLSLLYSITFYD